MKYYLLVQQCRRLPAVCPQKSASQGAPLLELHYLVKIVDDHSS